MPFWTITAKDVYLLVRDRRTATNLLLLPLAFITIIGLTTGQLLGWQRSNDKIKIAAIDRTDYDAIGSVAFLEPPEGADEVAEPPPEGALPAEDRGRERNVAKHLVSDILNRLQQTPGVEVRRVEDWWAQSDMGNRPKDPVEAARRLIDDNDLNAAVVFRPDFYRRFYHLEGVDLLADGDSDPSAADQLGRIGVEVITKDQNTSAAAAVEAIVGYHVLKVLQPVLAYRRGEWSVQQRATEKFRRAFGPVQRMETDPPAKLQPLKRDASTAFGGGTYDKLVPSYTVMFVFFLVNLMARSFIGEREIGTLRRLRVAPVAGWSILLGKTLPFLLVSLAQTAILFVAGRLIFGMSWGSYPWLLLPVIFATSCAATGLGLLIATLVRSDSQVSAYASTTVLILAGISGCFMPREWLPEAMQQVSLGTPHAWALIAYDQLLSQPVPNLAKVWQCVGALLAFAAGFFLLGGWRFRSDE